jgi:hypothetical protein
VRVRKGRGPVCRSRGGRGIGFDRWVGGFS